MGAFGLIVLSLAAAVEPPATARSPSPVRIVLLGDLPFSAAELEEALLARLPPDAPVGTLTLSLRPDGQMEISWQSMKRAVDVREESSSTAARVVALLATDLLMPVQPPPGGPPVSRQAALGREESRREEVVSLVAGYALSAEGTHLLQGFTAGAGVDRRALRFRVSAGWSSGTASQFISTEEWPLRASAGIGTSFLSLLASVVMVPYRLQGVADVTRIQAGGGLELESRFAIAAGFSLQVLAGADAYFNKRVQVRAGNIDFFETPLAAVRFEAAVSWEVPR
ncbi:MAG: hypothetical protein WBP56_02220 [Polyangia bacterium]